MGTFVPPRPRIAKWSLKDGRVVGSYRVFDVRRHLVEDTTGTARGDVFTFTCPDWCNVLALTPRGELVMVWQYRFGTDALSLEIPGGVIERGEPAHEAARRELLEETGYTADAFELVSTVEPNPALQGNRCHTFLARGARPVGATSFDPLEELEVVLVPTEHVGDLLDGGHVTHALVVVALERLLRLSAPRGPGA